MKEKLRSNRRESDGSDAINIAVVRIKTDTLRVDLAAFAECYNNPDFWNRVLQEVLLDG